MGLVRSFCSLTCIVDTLILLGRTLCWLLIYSISSVQGPEAWDAPDAEEYERRFFAAASLLLGLGDVNKS